MSSASATRSPPMTDDVRCAADRKGRNTLIERKVATGPAGSRNAKQKASRARSKISDHGDHARSLAGSQVEICCAGYISRRRRRRAADAQPQTRVPISAGARTAIMRRAARASSRPDHFIPRRIRDTRFCNTISARRAPWSVLLFSFVSFATNLHAARPRGGKIVSSA